MNHQKKKNNNHFNWEENISLLMNKSVRRNIGLIITGHNLTSLLHFYFNKHIKIKNAIIKLL